MKSLEMPITLRTKNNETGYEFENVGTY